MTIDQIVIAYSAFDNPMVMKLVDRAITEDGYEVTGNQTMIRITGGNLNELMAAFREIAPPVVNAGFTELLDERSDTE